MRISAVLILFLMNFSLWAAEPDESGIGGSGRDKMLPDMENFDIIQIPDAAELPAMIEIPEAAVENFMLPADAASSGSMTIPSPPETPGQ